MKYLDKYNRTFNYDIFRMKQMEESPFKFREDESFKSLVESIDKIGMLSPIIIIPHRKQSGYYEVISGMRRLEACKQLGYENISCIVADNLSRDDALIFMVDANLCNRENLLPSEKAAAYKIKLEAMKRQGYRTDLDEDSTSTTGLQKSTSIQTIADETGDSRETIRKYIRLNELTPELKDLVDEGRIALKPAVEISYLTEDEQRDLLDAIDDMEATPSHAQTIRMRSLSSAGKLDTDTIREVMSEQKPNQKESVNVPTDTFSKYVKGDRSPKKYREFVLKAIAYYCRHLDKQKEWDR